MSSIVHLQSESAATRPTLPVMYMLCEDHLCQWTDEEVRFQSPVTGTRPRTKGMMMTLGCHLSINQPLNFMLFPDQNRCCGSPTLSGMASNHANSTNPTDIHKSSQELRLASTKPHSRQHKHVHEPKCYFITFNVRSVLNKIEEFSVHMKIYQSAIHLCPGNMVYT